jgi:hypothetical protein
MEKNTLPQIGGKTLLTLSKPTSNQLNGKKKIIKTTSVLKNNEQIFSNDPQVFD